MSNKKNIAFAKYHGLGNDFIIADGRHLPRDLAKFARAITDRHTGVGADGLLALLKPLDTKNHARVRFFNADGSEAEMSGNGIRCAGAALMAEKRRQRVLRVETSAGVKILEPVSSKRETEKGKWIFRVNMGKPILEPDRIPFVAGSHPVPVVAFPLRTQQGILAATITSMGNPHCSIFVSDFSTTPWPAIGQEIEHNPLFPNRTNVEFVRVISKGEIEVRYWERGVGKTMSSGTGSCGAVVACILNRLTRRTVKVRTLAGTLEVSWPKDSEVLLTGPAEIIARGEYFSAI
ncbi:MAG: diaminopimelate epimerase [Acidobacteria bacterium]|nr:diaminopimelate epimerase [Acidobacteriota bacterium]